MKFTKLLYASISVMCLHSLSTHADNQSDLLSFDLGNGPTLTISRHIDWGKGRYYTNPRYVHLPEHQTGRPQEGERVSIKGPVSASHSGDFFTMRGVRSDVRNGVGCTSVFKFYKEGMVKNSISRIMPEGRHNPQVWMKWDLQVESANRRDFVVDVESFEIIEFDHIKVWETAVSTWKNSLPWIESTIRDYSNGAFEMLVAPNSVDRQFVLQQLREISTSQNMNTDIPRSEWETIHLWSAKEATVSYDPNTDMAEVKWKSTRLWAEESEHRTDNYELIRSAIVKVESMQAVEIALYINRSFSRK